MGIPTVIQDYQLREDVPIPGRQNRRCLRQETDIITTIDPPRELSAFVLGTVQGEPRMRAVIAFSTREGLEDAYDALGSAKVPVLITREVRRGLIILLERETSLRMVPKMFAFVNRNEEQRDYAITQAFRYPDCADIPGQWHTFTSETSSPRSEPA
ncbi:MAG: hypothetical protein PHX87_04565 [Candidatus Peribacteraceae bacterium]|nr:hypothetical protein [Candidatus Peribacteraceae bacterium]MDD5742671.1 hypothetical protein [Candidatus Peribacteraceae bacterium]